MGLLTLFSKSGPVVRRLPSGSVTADRQGNILATTVSSSYPSEVLSEVAREILALFREAKVAQMPVTELTIHFASLQITARELRGGAILFLSPKTVSSETDPRL
ncbi:MAG TPA: hypothetical protein VFM25_00945 [Verrucomicrobiae bacterium]|nr:hypothetical protein [Verrucomicrobiae bacterium]